MNAESAVRGTARCVTHRDAEAEASCMRCGDFVCRLCLPIENVALCARCALRASVDWEERGELGVVRAFLRTLSESVTGPRALGRKLGGSGHALAALLYSALAALCGLLPLTIVTAAPLLAWIDARRLGIDSTGFFGAAVSLVLGSVVCSTLLALGVAASALILWLWARSLRVTVRYDVLLRAIAYGTSPLALPIIGPLLVPLALLWSAIIAHGVLSARGGETRAWLVLAAPGGLLSAALGAVLWLWRP